MPHTKTVVVRLRQRHAVTDKAMSFALLSLIFPFLGPIAWVHAVDELDRVDNYEVTADMADRGTLALAEAISIATSCLTVAILLALVIGFA